MRQPQCNTCVVLKKTGNRRSLMLTLFQIFLRRKIVNTACYAIAPETPLQLRIDEFHPWARYTSIILAESALHQHYLSSKRYTCINARQWACYEAIFGARVTQETLNKVAFSKVIFYYTKWCATLAISRKITCLLHRQHHCTSKYYTSGRAA